MSVRSALLLVSALALSLSAATLYQDDFSRGLQGWKILTGGRLDTSSAGSVLRVAYADPYLGIVARTQTFRDFTYAIDVRPLTQSYANIGVGFCVQPDFSGYYFTVDSAKTFRVTRLHANEAEFLANLPDSRVSSRLNRLAVSRRGTETRFFCNDYLVASMNLDDPGLKGGWVAIAVAGPDGSAEFDDALVTDAFFAGAAQGCVEETFGAGAQDRWYSGLADESARFDFNVAGGLNIDTRNVAALQSPVFISGAFSGFSMRAILSWQGGDDSAAYGLCFVEIVQLPSFSFSYRSFGFLVNSLRQYAIVRPHSQIIDWQQTPSPFLHGGSAADTLAVVNAGGRHIFMANGDTLIMADVRGDFAYEAAGLSVSPGVRIRCESFAVSPDAAFMCPIRSTTLPRTWEETGIAGEFLFDALGRTMNPGRKRPSTSVWMSKGWEILNGSR